MVRRWAVVLAVALVGAGQDAVRTSAPSHDEVAVLWRDPGEIESMDLSGGPGGAQGEPQPPFQFLDEPMTGTTAKIRIVDAKGVRWMVKFGEEVRPQTFAARLVWAMGYFALPIYFVPDGTILGVAGLTRAAKYVAPNGRFRDASFEIYVDSPVRWLDDRQSWSWNANPFVGTHQLNGLKVLLMLLSDWDNKDARNVTRGSNTAILVYPGDEARYLVTDWGASMGTWGSYVDRSKWNCFGFELQTRDFVRLGPRGRLEWGYVGQDTENFINGISVEDVRWLLTYLGRMSDAQLRDGLRASGATPAETSCFSRALRKRIAALQALRGVRSEAPGSARSRARGRDIDDVLGDEPDLEFIAANDVADQQIVRPIVAAAGGQPRHRASLLEYHLVCVEQPRDLDRRRLASAGRARDDGRFRNRDRAAAVASRAPDTHPHRTGLIRGVRLQIDVSIGTH